ncbi:MAG: hypothetical protein P4L84_03245 [Isosphaeraceae bacterium]|nr:hypothetical protein [Isosphaeraceae bacterium]
MDAPGRADWFVGDLGDPWVAAIGSSLPESVERVHCAGPLREELLAGHRVPGRLAVHRGLLTPRDAECLARYRAGGSPAPRVVLCVGPHIRHAELERWAVQGLFDDVVPEATARDTLARRLAADEGGVPRPLGTRPRVCVVSTNFEMRETLAEACETAGFPALPARDWSEAPPQGPALWDVPVLEPGWPMELARRSRVGPVVALIGFPDRALVAEARERGASACLELPCDLADLVGVLDRLASPRAEAPHAFPPVPASVGRRRPSRVAAGEGDA